MNTVTFLTEYAGYKARQRVKILKEGRDYVMLRKGLCIPKVVLAEFN